MKRKIRFSVTGILALLPIVLAVGPARASGANVNSYMLGQGEYTCLYANVPAKCWDVEIKAIATGYVNRATLYFDYTYYVGGNAKDYDSDTCTVPVGSTGCTRHSREWTYSQLLTNQHYQSICVGVVTYQRNGAHQQVYLESDLSCRYANPDMGPAVAPR